MTSKISYPKFIIENLKHRAWLVALSLIAQFIILPVYTLMYIDNKKLSLIDPSSLKELKEWASYNFTGLLNGQDNFFVVILFFGMGLLCAVTGFSYLHSKVKQDFYHSMSLTRTQWFLISYISGLLIFLVPFILFSLCTVFIGQLNGLMTASLLLYCLKAILYGIMVFFLSYHTCIFAMMLTGQIITGVLAYAVLLVYGSAILGLLDAFCSVFLHTWVSYLSPFNSVFSCSSPVALAANFIGATVSDSGMTLSFSHIGNNNVKIWSISVLVLIVFFVASLLLYKKYPSEAAENALSFPKTGGVIKCLIAIPCALGIGLFSNAFFGYSQQNHWLFILSILFVILVCFLVEFIYHHDLKMIGCGKLSTGISLAGVLMILCTFQFDLFGYDSYIPEEDSLSSMSVYCYDNNNYYDYQLYKHDTNRILEKTATTDFHPLYELVKRHKSADDTAHLSNIIVRFERKKGRPIYREYGVDYQDLSHAFESKYQDLNYRKQENPIFNIQKEDVDYFQLEDIYNTPLSLDHLTKEQKSNLLEAYKNDFLNADFNTLTNEYPIAKLYMGYTLNRTSKDQSTNSSNMILYLHKDFSNTLSLLKEYGYIIREKIDQNDILRMMYTPTGSADSNETDEDLTPREIVDPKKIQDILDHLTLIDNQRLLKNNIYTKYTATVSITLNTGDELQFPLLDDK